MENGVQEVDQEEKPGPMEPREAIVRSVPSIELPDGKLIRISRTKTIRQNCIVYWLNFDQFFLRNAKKSKILNWKWS